MTFHRMLFHSGDGIWSSIFVHVQIGFDQKYLLFVHNQIGFDQKYQQPSRCRQLHIRKLFRQFLIENNKFAIPILNTVFQICTPFLAYLFIQASTVVGKQNMTNTIKFILVLSQNVSCLCAGMMFFCLLSAITVQVLH